MTQVYSDPSRADEPHALPNMEVFEIKEDSFATSYTELEKKLGWKGKLWVKGWYYHACFPGCLPDSPASGPYDTEEEAKVACMDEFL
jgi:hypothetical protein